MEITVNVLMNNIEKDKATLSQMKAMGIRVALNDFGTGYSSLSYLAVYTVDIRKIDRSYVMGGVQQPKNSVIIKAIIAMGHSPGTKIAAEGVETTLEQLELVKRYGADEARGYFLSRPVPASEYLELLARRVL